MFEYGLRGGHDDRIKTDENGRKYRVEPVFYSDEFGGSSVMERVYLDEYELEAA